ncbi:MAG TPA: phosphoglycerate dehydrogenase [Candidatus Baltobacteraceae bacterium]|jgi:D-3-phosphoglycerate dehydrogenase|nr:phosphoglycerate dehydrogenase [Candidatus Baltobacteraceae bacterium]
MTEPRPSTSRVIVAEPFAESGLAVLREHGIEVVSCIGKPREALCAALAEADGLIVRSETRVDRDLLRAGPRLSVVARAGVGVDAIDVEAATSAGIVVLNTPGANMLAATEQTFALMLGLVRHLPAANASLRANIWDRKPFIGTELHGKTLGIIGLGRIGSSVAVRASAFGMKLLAHDPFISRSRAESFNAELISLEELLGRSDIVTLHVPLNAQTLGMIDAEKLALLRPHARLINCARGGVIDEAALLAALDAGVLAGAAIDVVAKEPPPAGGTGSRLHQHPKVVASPHLGGSTHEALERIAVDLARDVASVLLGGTANAAVNAPIGDGADADRLRPFVDVAYRIGRLYPQIARASQSLPEFSMVLEGAIADLPADALVTAFLTGLLQQTTDRRVSIVNSRSIATELGIRIEARGVPQAELAASELRVIGGEISIVGTHAYGGTRLLAIDDYEIDAVPAGAMLLTKHRDVPGMIGKVGTILGEAQINISAMQVSRAHEGGSAIMILSTDRRADAATIERIRGVAGIDSVRAVELPAIPNGR